MIDKKKQGKKNRKRGAEFEREIRKDLESKGWIVSKWMNNVELIDLYPKANPPVSNDLRYSGKLIPAKHKYNPFMRALSIGTGFPDFIAYDIIIGREGYKVIGVECKINRYLSKEEKEKCRWLINGTNKIFSRILIAFRNKEKKIEYKEFK